MWEWHPRESRDLLGSPLLQVTRKPDLPPVLLMVSCPAASSLCNSLSQGRQCPLEVLPS